MARENIIRRNFEEQWKQGQDLSVRLLKSTQETAGRSYLPVHGDPILGLLDEHDLICYFVYTLSSWWEIPLIDRINADRQDNNFAIIMDINPAPETMYRLGSRERRSPEIRYKTGLKEMFPSLDSDVADAMYSLLRNGFGHNLFGREPSKILFDNDFDCPPKLDEHKVLLVPPVRLALSMISAFLTKIAMLFLLPTQSNMKVFKAYMTSNS